MMGLLGFFNIVNRSSLVSRSNIALTGSRPTNSDSNPKDIRSSDLICESTLASSAGVGRLAPKPMPLAAMRLWLMSARPVKAPLIIKRMFLVLTVLLSLLPVLRKRSTS